MGFASIPLGARSPSFRFNARSHFGSYCSYFHIPDCSLTPATHYADDLNCEKTMHKRL